MKKKEEDLLDYFCCVGTTSVLASVFHLFITVLASAFHLSRMVLVPGVALLGSAGTLQE